MLFSPVYTEAHPRRNAAFASRPDVWTLGGNRGRFPVPEMNLRDAANTAPSSSLKSFNPFAFKRFRTLLRNGRNTTLFLSIDSALFPLQWGCIPPSVYFPRLPFLQSRLFLTLLTRSLRSFTKECLGTPLPPTRSALFFKTAGCMAICNQFLELELLDRTGGASPTPTGSGGVCRVRWRRRSRLRVRGKRGAREGRRGGERRDRARPKEPRGW
jgi:hypothetical protein